MRGAEKQMLGGDVFVLKVCRFAKRLFKRFVEHIAQAGLGCRTGNTRQFFLERMQIALQPFGGNTDLFKHRRDDALAVFNERQQQMQRLHLGVAKSGGALLRLLQCLLRLDGQFFPTNCHNSAPSF